MNGRGVMGRRRGFSLIEAAIVVVMVAIAVPPASRMVVDASNERADRVLLVAGTTYAGALVEQIMADVSGTGFEQLDDAGAYLDTVGTGLWARTEWLSAPYQARDIEAEVTISALVARDGTVSESEDDNRFRLVTVTISVPTLSGEWLELPISVMLGDPSP